MGFDTAGSRPAGTKITCTITSGQVFACQTTVVGRRRKLQRLFQHPHMGQEVFIRKVFCMPGTMQNACLALDTDPGNQAEICPVNTSHGTDCRAAPAAVTDFHIRDRLCLQEPGRRARLPSMAYSKAPVPPLLLEASAPGLCLSSKALPDHPQIHPVLPSLPRPVFLCPPARKTHADRRPAAVPSTRNPFCCNIRCKLCQRAAETPVPIGTDSRRKSAVSFQTAFPVRHNLIGDAPRIHGRPRNHQICL